MILQQALTFAMGVVVGLTIATLITNNSTISNQKLTCAINNLDYHAQNDNFKPSAYCKGTDNKIVELPAMNQEQILEKIREGGKK